MRWLVVSPIATHPQNQGNSARIYAFCRALQARGHLVHVLYYTLEGLTAPQQSAMQAAWDGFHVCKARRIRRPPTGGEPWALDDWYDVALGEEVARLVELWQFDAVIVNYVWMSAALGSVPTGIPRILDSHDIFGGRASHFSNIGLAPEWFHTTREAERSGLARADLVIAIQSQEARHLTSLVAGLPTRVVTIGHVLPRRFLPLRQGNAVQVVGYLGSGNPFNVESIRTMSRDLLENEWARGDFRFVLAGNVCHRFSDGPAPFEPMGAVDTPDDFYEEVDIVVNPMVGGTGLKIKTLEALSFGLPVLGTADAWVGIADPLEIFPENPGGSVLDGLQALAARPELLHILRSRCRNAFIRYQRAELQAMDELMANVLEASQRPSDPVPLSIAEQKSNVA